MNQTENYVILKPISERFNRIAKEITDDELKQITKDTLKEQLKSTVNFWRLQEMLEEVMEEREEEIKAMIMESMKKKL